MFYLIIIAAIFGADCAIKDYREKRKEQKSYLNDNVRMMTYHNEGAFLNAGERKPVVVKILSVLLTLLITVFFCLTLTTHGNRALKTGLSFLLGGAFCNTYDRLRRHYVVDYLNFPKLPGRLKNVVYNISDFFILIGTLLSVIAI